jgi:hypothetical protein
MVAMILSYFDICCHCSFIRIPISRGSRFQFSAGWHNTVNVRKLFYVIKRDDSRAVARPFRQVEPNFSSHLPHTCRSTDGKLWSYKENKSFELELQAEYWPKFHAGSFRGHNAPLAEVAPTPSPAKKALIALIPLFAIFLDFDVDAAPI